VSVDGLAPRWAAFKALQEWRRKGGYLQDHLQAPVTELEERDRGLAWELAFGVCRNYRRLLSVIETFTAGSPPKVQVELSLMLGLYQIFFLDRVPAHAAVHVTVDLARKVGGDGAARLTNAILQRSIREGMPKLSSDPVQALAMEFSLQDWLVAKWIRESKGDVAGVRTRLEYLRKVPGQWIRLHRPRAEAVEFLQRMELTDARVWRERWIEVGSRVGALLHSQEFQQGLFSVQNPASQLLADLLGVQKEERVWDACAAPGGKTALLLESEPTIKMLASDCDADRLKSMGDLHRRLHLPNFRIEVCDASKPAAEWKFDKVLLDVPCSNLGVMARRPEVGLRLDRRSYEEVVKRQRRILEGASQAVVPGGVLVYATCSPEPEETDGLIRDFLGAHPEFLLDDASERVEARFVKDSCVRAFDAEMGFDAFFGARLRRVL